MAEPQTPSVGAVQAQRAGFLEPLILKAGKTLASYELVYETYGALNAARSNAVLVCHACRAATTSRATTPTTREDRLVGQHDRPGQGDRHRALLRGRREQHRRLPRLHRPGLHRPRDRHALGRELPGGDRRGLGRLAGAARGPARASRGWPPPSAARWAACRRCSGRSPTPSACPRAGDRRGAAPVHAEIAFNDVARQAIVSDPDFHGGNSTRTRRSRRGDCKLARMLGHITYLSEDQLMEKFGRAASSATSTASTTTSSSRSSPTCATRATSSRRSSTPTPTC